MARAEGAAQLQEELIAELKALRTAVRDVTEAYLLAKEGEIEALLDYLLKLSPGRQRKLSRFWLRDIRALSPKPGKGRLKDMKRIDRLLQELLDHLIEVDQDRTAKTVRQRGARRVADLEGEGKSPLPPR